jgi:glycosyltransferase involved in cell wall biosynthesis
MHVGLNLLYLVPGETGGRETYARELIPRLAEADPTLRITLFLNREAAAEGGASWREAGQIVRIPVSGRSRAQWAAGEQLLLPRTAARAGVDVLHSLANFAPAWGRFARVVTVHDLLYLRHPEFLSRLMRLGTRTLVPLGARRSDRVITVSESSREELVRLLRIPEQRIDVVPNGLGVTTAREAPEPWVPEAAAGRPVVLSVATRLPHKNLGALLEAAALMPADERPLFVLAGSATKLDGELMARAGQLGVAGDVLLTPWLPPEKLESLYAAASCFALPTLYEGFGMPVLEAMVRGVPVACSDLPVLREVAGSAARFFDPRDPNTIATTLRELLAREPERDRLRAAGYERAGHYTWEAAAEATLRSYERATDRVLDL